MVNLANPAPRIAVEILFLDGGLCDGRKKIVAESRKCAPKKIINSYSRNQMCAQNIPLIFRFKNLIFAKVLVRRFETKLNF